jgi:phage gpG-like protein
MLYVNVKITGTAEEIAKFQKLGDKLLDFTQALTETGTELKTYYSKAVFGSGGGLTGTKWKSLSPVYAKWKGKHYPNRGILIARGDMQNSFRATSNRSSLTIDNTDKKFEYHQLGTRRMPARPMLVVNKDVEEVVERIIEADVEKKLRSVF